MHRVLLLVSLCASACTAKAPAPTPISDSAGSGGDPVAEPTKPSPSRPSVMTKLANETESCQRTLCIAGPGGPASPANVDLGDLCRQAPGVLRRCEGDTCKSAWMAEDWQAGLDGLIASLDLDASGKVDAGDPSCTINVVGWSTGAAIAAGPLVAALVADARMTSERAKIERLVVVAAHQAGVGPDGSASLVIPEQVENAWIYRNSVAPANDCSTSWESGPWLSPKPVCGATTTCWDYDYSLEPMLAFVSRRGARSGAAIDHCNIMAVVAKIALDNLERGIEAQAEHVPRLSDGRAGGRPHDTPPSP